MKVNTNSPVTVVNEIALSAEPGDVLAPETVVEVVAVNGYGITPTVTVKVLDAPADDWIPVADTHTIPLQTFLLGVMVDLGAVEDVVATGGALQVSVAFTEIPAAASYALQFDTVNTFANAVDLAATESPKVVDGLQAATEYFFRLAAVDADGNQFAWSDTASATTNA